MIVSPVVILLAVIGLSVLIARSRTLWATRSESSRSAKRQRVRFAVLGISILGLLLLFIVQLAQLPVWLAEVGIILLFASWGGYLLLSMIFGFKEGYEEVMNHCRKDDRSQGSD